VLCSPEGDDKAPDDNKGAAHKNGGSWLQARKRSPGRALLPGCRRCLARWTGEGTTSYGPGRRAWSRPATREGEGWKEAAKRWSGGEVEQYLGVVAKSGKRAGGVIFYRQAFCHSTLARLDLQS